MRIKKILGVCIMCITIPHGIIWMVSGEIVSSMVALIINTYYTGKLINVGYIKQMGDLLPIFGVSFSMWLIIHASLFLTDNMYAQLIIGVSSGLAFYVISAKILLKSEWNEAMEMVLNKIK